MTKRRPKALIYADIADAVKCMREGKKVKRSTNKDGSIATKPVSHLYVPPLPEKEVLAECLKWLRKRGCVADRLDAGSARMNNGQIYRYGIIGAGDIMGILPNGQHFEIECKNGVGGKWSISQQRRKKKIERNNALYFICHGVAELEYFIGEYLNKPSVEFYMCDRCSIKETCLNRYKWHVHGCSTEGHNDLN